MSTVTSTLVAKAIVKANEKGLNVVTCKYIIGSTGLTAGSVIQMIPIPDRAIIYEGQLRGSGASNCKLSVGDGGDADRFISTATQSTTSSHQVWNFFEKALTIATGFGYQYSLSDDAAVKWDTIDILTGSASLTGTVMLRVSYYMDAP
jgi:hypothetical protein